jgi:6-phosphogluconate dehydrogenase
MKLAVSGLGRMGAQIAQKLAEGGHDVIAHNRSPEPVTAAEAYGAQPAFTKDEVVAAFGDETPIVWLMIPANVIDDELDSWLEILPAGSILIDGGNSDYRGDAARAERAAAKGMALLDIGKSRGRVSYAKRGSI